MATTLRPRRSALYLPGNNARALEKGKTLPADVLIFDLEDAVGPEAKVDSRARVCEAIATGSYQNREIVVRINGLGTNRLRRWPLHSTRSARPNLCNCGR
jgi:citrate lyase subunit beta/citryl-CoA lyase